MGSGNVAQTLLPSPIMEVRAPESVPRQTSQPGQLVPTTSLLPQLPVGPLTTTVPVLTSNITHVNSEVVEYVSITPNPKQLLTTDLSKLTAPISVIDVTPPTELRHQNIPDRISVNVDIPGKQKDKALIKSDDSIQINNPNSEDTSVDREVNEKETTSTREGTVLLLANDTPDTTHISILLDAQDVITEGVEHETQPFDNNRTDATTTWEATRTTQQHTPTDDNTNEAKSNTTNDKMSSNTSEEIDNTTGTLTNTDIASEEIDNTTGSLNNTDIARKPITLIEGRVPSYPDQLVKCYCDAKEVLTKEGCQFYQGDTYIKKEIKFRKSLIPVGSMDVVIHEPDCNTVHGHRQMNFSKDEFYLRQRGDVVLMKSIMSSPLYRCIDKQNSTFSPPFIAEPSSYKVVHGYPLCLPKSQEFNISIDARGFMYAKDRKFEASSYCSDEFTDGKHNFRQGAYICLARLSEWDKARDIAFPVCHAISLVFLALTVVCYCLVPVLLQQGGWCQLFHVLSLMLAYSSKFAQQLFGQYWNGPTCIAMAVVLQFGFLCTFFWLSVLCFEVWRKIKSLNKLLPATKQPLKSYLLYAFGGPFLICTVTVCMQFWAPSDVVGVVKPHLGVSRCWFYDTLATLVYFFGPIAFLFTCNIVFITHTFWIYRQIERNAKVLKNLGGEKTSSEGSAAASKTLRTEASKTLTTEASKTLRTEASKTLTTEASKTLRTEASKTLRTAEHKYRRRDYVADFKQQFSLLVLMSICWVTEVLSWKIPPLVMWAATDILNTLQGFFVFIIFVANRSKRKHLKKKFPTVFVGVKIVTSVLIKIKGAFMLIDSNGKEVSPINLLTSTIGRKISTTSLMSNISTLSTTLTVKTSSSSSFSLSSSERSNTKRSSSFSDSDDGIITVSHTTLTPSDSISSDSPC
ncbi:hypothetical protein Pmani_029618 [Petrolisthes manimaculis]|uniref:G-protein coupled receptors family 2 profile 2 domain-containing protein n=1 Tax=Petrolisthes manimaculis TaxID=1843537 RepID=A0AAE1TWT7_9EUCA|nr:hypothetical protein Pmani_029618 [Petrolisthes manimaculis]